MNKRKFIIFGVIIFGILFIISMVLMVSKINKSRDLQKEADQVFIPEYLSSEEKQSLGIPEETNIQVINRDSEGGVSVYKIVESENQVVNPKEVGPLSPRMEELE